MKNELKDWQIAQIMFNKNTKKECKLVADLRKHGTIENLCDDWSIVYDKRLVDDCGWLIPNECL
jgi:hypothetical protein